jgi:hypothetical protein
MERRNYHWQAVVKKLRRRPGKWSLEFQNVPERSVRLVRLKRHPALRFEDGYLQAQMTESYLDDEGTRRGSLWVRLVLYQDQPTDTIGESHAQEDQRMDE